MTHDPLCPVGVKPWEDTYCCQTCNPGETTLAAALGRLRDKL